ncbi:hypothetical protein [Schumannella soli]|uniref:Uncharacterized protein n=1 Tax=Schumannella soli TaxID=2590779 RepID=A0A506Y8I9_9MICO|nr:hypothetical protein [Schumannella soli]TPW77507.1 hypothetical protein FJ657_02155 [Schumannella soli]
MDVDVTELRARLEAVRAARLAHSDHLDGEVAKLEQTLESLLERLELHAAPAAGAAFDVGSLLDPDIAYFVDHEL